MNIRILTPFILALGLSACASTWDGMKEDARNNVNKADETMKKASDSIERQWDKTSEGTKRRWNSTTNAVEKGWDNTTDAVKEGWDKITK